MRFKLSSICLLVILCGLVQCYIERDNYNDNILVQRPKEEIDYVTNEFETHYEKTDEDLLEEFTNGSTTRESFKENTLKSVTLVKKRFKPDWSDLDTRPLPEWYDKAKIGIFLHWGVFSVPSFHSEWFWWYWRSEKNPEITEYMEKNYPPGFTYQEFAPMFKAEFFEPNRFAELFAKSGAKYVVLTSKHHEGYTLFPSNRSFSWNSVDVGPHRDLVRDLSSAVRAAGLKFGVYHSLYEWYNPIYLADKNENFTTKKYVFDKLWPDIKELINEYQPSVLWSDGDWEAQDSYWNSTDLLAWLYNDSPVKDEIVVNDRWGKDIPCHHGDFYNCQDRYNPGALQHHKWENAFTLDRHTWGYSRRMNLSDVLTTQELLKEVVSTVSCGGNALINVGPTKEGTIAPIFEERLLALGEWLSINGEAIYGSSPWKHQNDSADSNVWYTCKKTKYHPRQPTAVPAESDEVRAVYAMFLMWPEKNTLYLGDVGSLVEQQWQIELLGNEGTRLKWKTVNNQTSIRLPHKEAVVSKDAWTLKFRPTK